MKTLEIKFDNPCGVFEAGTEVSGIVCLTVDKPTKFKSLQLLFYGGAKTGWNKSDTKAQNNVVGQEKYLYRDEKLFPLEDNVQCIDVSAGSHVYPFSCKLQNFLPSSFEGWRGYVRYYCKATLEKPWKFNKHVKRAFTVIHHLDLSPRPVEPVTTERRVDVKGCCFRSGYVKLDLSLTKTDFVPGEPVEFNITVSNHSNKMVSRIWLELKQAVTYTAYNTAANGKTAEDIVKKRSFMFYDGEVNIAYKEKDSVSGATIVPSLPPSHLEGCQIIDISYYIVATALCGELFKLRQNITIGTIPSLHLHRSNSNRSVMMVESNGSKEMLNGKSSGNSLNGNHLLSMNGGSPNGSLSVPSSPTLVAPPPTYEECVCGHTNIRDDDDDDYTDGDMNWVPAYPFYDYKLHMGHKYKNEPVTIMRQHNSDKSMKDEVMVYD